MVEAVRAIGSSFDTFGGEMRQVLWDSYFYPNPELRANQRKQQGIEDMKV
jgi:hypothetical protein